jgi:hypothetical protein
MGELHSTFCLHRNIFRIALEGLKLVSTLNSFDIERLLAAEL